MRVLVLDDDRFALDFARRVLEEEGHEVIALETWTAASSVLFHSAIDLALIDVVLPGIQGDRLVQIAKASPVTDRTRFVLLSNLGEDEIKRRASTSGADGWRQKPLTSGKLRGILRELGSGERAS